MKENKLYVAEMALLRYKYSLSEISEKLHYLGKAIWEGYNEEDAAKEVGDVSKELYDLSKSINLSIKES
jgi:hypothetical protein